MISIVGIVGWTFESNCQRAPDDWSRELACHHQPRLVLLSVSNTGGGLYAGKICFGFRSDFWPGRSDSSAAGNKSMASAGCFRSGASLGVLDRSSGCGMPVFMGF